MSDDRAGGALGRAAFGPARQLQGCRPQASGIGVKPQNDLRSPSPHPLGEAISEAAAIAPAGRRTERSRGQVDGLRCVSHALRDSFPTS